MTQKLSPDLLPRRTGRIVVPPKAEKPEKKPASDVKTRLGRLSDLVEASPASPDVRAIAGGYMRPAVELNAQRPAQVGPGRSWHMRSHPALIIRPQDQDIITMPDGSKVAVAEPDISYPFGAEYRLTPDGRLSERAFNHVNPNAEIDAGCAGDTFIPLDDFITKGRLIVHPHPDAHHTRLRIWIRDSTGTAVRLYFRFAASRTLYGPSNGAYGKTTVQIDPHHVGATTYNHTIGTAGTGGGAWSDGDGVASAGSTPVTRSVEDIAPGAGPAIVDVYAQYPMSRYQVAPGPIFATRSAWGVRLR